MLNLIVQRLREQFRGIIFYLIGLIGYAWVMIAMFPSINKTMNLDEYVNQMPKEMIKFFSGSETLSYSKIEGFLSMEYLSLFFVLIIIFYIAASAGSAIAGTIEKRIMDFNLSQPISRTKIVLGETMVGLFYTFVLVNLTTVSIWLLCKAYDIVIQGKGLIAFSVAATVFMWAIYGIAIFLSSVMRSKIGVVAATVFIVLAFYISNSLANIIDKIAKLKDYSLFTLYKPQTLLETGTINAHQVEVCLLIFVVGLTASIIIFNRKDV